MHHGVRNLGAGDGFRASIDRMVSHASVKLANVLFSEARPLFAYVDMTDNSPLSETRRHGEVLNELGFRLQNDGSMPRQPRVLDSRAWARASLQPPVQSATD